MEKFEHFSKADTYIWAAIFFWLFLTFQYAGPEEAPYFLEVIPFILFFTGIFWSIQVHKHYHWPMKAEKIVLENGNLINKPADHEGEV